MRIMAIVKGLDGEVSISAPAFVTDEKGVTQLEERLREGYDVLVVLPKPINAETEAAVVDVIAKSDAKISFDVRTCTRGNFDTGSYNLRLNSIKKIRDKFPERISATVGTKFGNAIELNTNSAPPLGQLASSISAEDYLKSVDQNITLMRALVNTAEVYGLNIGFENRPNPNFSNIKNFTGLEEDFHPRNKGWSPILDNNGTHGCGPVEIAYLHKKTGIFSIALDIEHLTHPAMHGFIFHLKDKGDYVRFGDLPEDEQDMLIEHGFPNLQKEDVLWDLRGYNEKEAFCRDHLGFVVRKGQPQVYAEKQTLVNCVDGILETGIKIESVAPGFQVFPNIYDDGQLKITSHMPGIPEDIIVEPANRARCENQLACIYQLVYDKLLVGRKIRDIELEPGTYDKDKPVNGGPIWKEQMEQTKRMALSLLERAANRQVDMSKAPAYFGEYNPN